MFSENNVTTIVYRAKVTTECLYKNSCTGCQSVTNLVTPRVNFGPVSLFHPLTTRLPTRPDSSLRYRRYINHLLTYLLTYLLIFPGARFFHSTTDISLTFCRTATKFGSVIGSGQSKLIPRISWTVVRDTMQRRASFLLWYTCKMVFDNFPMFVDSFCVVSIHCAMRRLGASFLYKCPRGQNLNIFATDTLNFEALIATILATVTECSIIFF